MLKSLQQFTENPQDGFHQFALELSEEIKTTFSYVLDPDDDDFCPEFLTATYFSPEFLVKEDSQKAAVRRYLEGNNKVIVYRIGVKI